MANTNNNLDGQKMRALAEGLKELLNPDGLGFCLLVFPTGSKDGIANYVSDCDREDMIKFLEETTERLKKNRDFRTPESN